MKSFGNEEVDLVRDHVGLELMDPSGQKELGTIKLMAKPPSVSLSKQAN